MFMMGTCAKNVTNINAMIITPTFAWSTSNNVLSAKHWNVVCPILMMITAVTGVSLSKCLDAWFCASAQVTFLLSIGLDWILVFVPFYDYYLIQQVLWLIAMIVILLCFTCLRNKIIINNKAFVNFYTCLHYFFLSSPESWHA